MGLKQKLFLNLIHQSRKGSSVTFLKQAKVDDEKCCQDKNKCSHFWAFHGVFDHVDRLAGHDGVDAIAQRRLIP